jgi:hypothetical protein
MSPRTPRGTERERTNGSGDVVAAPAIPAAAQESRLAPASHFRRESPASRVNQLFADADPHASTAVPD